MKEEIRKSDKHKQQEKEHGDNTLSYKVVYEYKSALMAAEIFKQVTKHFILPVEMERYFAKVYNDPSYKGQRVQ